MGGYRGRGRRQWMQQAMHLSLLVVVLFGSGDILKALANQTEANVPKDQIGSYNIGELIASSNDAEPEENSCQDIGKLPPDQDRCVFAKEYCHSEGLVPFFVIYHCYAAPYGPILSFPVLGVFALFLCILFYVMSHAADEYFSAILSQISQDIGLPPRLGGVTFLALGNGAPDLSSNIAAVRSGHYSLALGSLTGGAMFVGCVVAGRIISVSKGVKCRGAQIRDVSTLFFAVALVTGIVASGNFSYVNVGAVLLVYATYVVIVAVADFSKRAGIDIGSLITERMSIHLNNVWGIDVNLGAPLLESRNNVAASSDDYELKHSIGSTYKPNDAQSNPNSHNRGGNTVKKDFKSKVQIPKKPTVTVLEEASQSSLTQNLAAKPNSVNEIYDALSSRDAEIYATAQKGPELELTSPPTSRSRSPNSSADVSSIRTDDGKLSVSSRKNSGHLDTAALTSLQSQRSVPRSQTVPANVAFHSDVNDSTLSSEIQPQGPFNMPSEDENNVRSNRMEANQIKRAKTSATIYDEIVHMSAQEYRKRALADMAAARSFYKRFSTEENSVGNDEEMQALIEEDVEDEDTELCLGTPTGDQIAVSPSLRVSTSVQDLEPKQEAAIKIASGYTPPDIASVSQHFIHEILPEERRTHSDADMASSSRVAESFVHNKVNPGELTIHENNNSNESSISNFITSTASSYLKMMSKPVLIALKSSIPIVEASMYKREWFLLSIAISPLFVSMYIFGPSFVSIVISVASGCLLSLLFTIVTRNGGIDPPFWDMGFRGVPVGAGMLAVYGFILAAMWIDVFASEIVGALQFFGIMMGIHPAIIGATVLSWGNSLTDLMANTSMALKSSAGTSMAMTACFAGPIFNILVGLGVGFWSLLADRNITSTPISFDLVILIGCIFLMTNCAGIIMMAMANKPRHRLSAGFGWFMISWYCLYLAVVVMIALHR